MLKHETLTVPKVHRPLLNGLWLAIASVLRKLNAGYDDREIRLHMYELTKKEAWAEIRGDIANEEYHRRLHEFWTSGG